MIARQVIIKTSTDELIMNKLGLLAGSILAVFLGLTSLPMGYSFIPLYLFNDNGVQIGIFGITINVSTGGPLSDSQSMMIWWFLYPTLRNILLGILFWIFPAVSTIICFAGINKPSERAKRIYSGAFFLLLVLVILIFLDGLFIGEIFMSHRYGVLEFFTNLNVGFWIVIFDMIIMILAGSTYKEI
ncbi:MAG: hypothetical protein ACTSRA_17750 [Promethearchaeota archaeon]